MASAGHFPATATGAGSQQGTELERLERAVQRLIEERAKLSHENESLREELASMRGLQDQLRAESELRRGAVERIDRLVGWIEKLDPSVADGGAQGGAE